MGEKPSVTVIIPAYNEEKTIGSLIDRIPDGYEVIVVDDNSGDATSWKAREHGAKVVRNSNNLGPELSKQKGIFAARGEIIVTMDADGEHGPEDIEELIDMLVKGYDMVLGERRHLPRLTERLMAWMVRRRVRGIKDATTGFRAFWKRRMRRVDMSKSLYGTNMILQMRRLGMNISSVPIHTKPRRSNSRINPFKIIWNILALTRYVVFF
ncbi:MAG: hypothetical protein DRO99_02415 [Candidatus Aenigmatarchaeota archaeon]|nr:MAG: hypothetical protein DRO99_02415 [Candidatus Aenigmarchaeota archaeon]